MRPITTDMLDGFSRRFHADAVNELRRNAVMKNGPDAACERMEERIANPMIFSIELKDTGAITDQRESGRCWLFAALNTMRYEIIHRLGLESIELSQSYQMFWDKLEKANYFLGSIIATAAEPLEGRLVAHLLKEPMQDGGQWDMYAALADKYGCVPQYVMPETRSSSSSTRMDQLLTRKLREDARLLRETVAAGGDPEALREDMLAEIYSMLVIFLGEPPRSFDFEYRGRDGVFHRDAGITPRQFFERYVGLTLSDYVSVINAPTADKPYGRTFTVAYLGNVEGGRPVKYLNLPSEELKRLAIAQLSDGRPVWFGCDVGKWLMRDYGIMGMRTLDYEGVLGVRFGLDKAGRLDYGESQMTHAMVFQGVNLVDGRPNRWKVENSWGTEKGQNGWYIMTDEWFDAYNYQVVVNRKYLTEEQSAQLEQEPIVLEPWDPMGSLA